MYKSYAVVIGMLITVMIALNSVLSAQIGLYKSGVIIHAAGLIAAIAIILIKGLKVKVNKGIPFYLYSSGLIGVILVMFNNMTTNNIGVSLTIALGLTGQSIASLTIDHFGIAGMTKSKINKHKVIGLLIVVVGLVIMYSF